MRALLFDDLARPIDGALARRKYQFHYTEDGGAEALPELLCHMVDDCIDEVLTHPAACDLRAVALAAFAGSVSGIDSSGRAITPLYTYADTRGADLLDSLYADLDAEAVHQRTGCPPHTAYLPLRLHWLQRKSPKRVAQVRQWVDIGGYCIGRWLRDGPAWSLSMASWSGLLNRQRVCWDTQMLGLLGLTTQDFAPLADHDAPRVGLRDNYAKRWPRLHALPFYLPIGDGAAANVGSGAVTLDRAALSIGTTAALRQVVPGPEVPPVPVGMWGYRVTGPLHLIGGATSEGGNVWNWMLDLLKLHPGDIEGVLYTREAMKHGLDLLPLLAGERSPGWYASAVGALSGLRLSTSRLDLAQAVMDGVALRLSLLAGRLLGHPEQMPVTLMGSGGLLTHSLAWTQAVASALARPIHRIDVAEVTARGAAVLALAHLDRQALEDYAPPLLDVTPPIAADVQRYAEARARQESLYRWMRD